MEDNVRENVRIRCTFDGIFSNDFIERIWEKKPWICRSRPEITTTTKFKNLQREFLPENILGKLLPEYDPVPVKSRYPLGHSVEKRIKSGRKRKRNTTHPQTISESLGKLHEISQDLQKQTCRPERVRPRLVHRKDISLVRCHSDLKSIGEEFYKPPDTLLSPTDIRDAWKQGFSIVIPRISEEFPDIAEMCSRILPGISGVLVSANLYATPTHCKGLQPHYDDHCVLILQLSGEKKWTLTSRPLASLPRLGAPRCPVTMEDGSRQNEECFQKLILRAGDVMYVPRGVGHFAECRGKLPSVHLTFAVEIEPHCDYEALLHILLQQYYHPNSPKTHPSKSPEFSTSNPSQTSKSPKYNTLQPPKSPKSNPPEYSNKRRENMREPENRENKAAGLDSVQIMACLLGHVSLRTVASDTCPGLRRACLLGIPGFRGGGHVSEGKDTCPGLRGWREVVNGMREEDFPSFPTALRLTHKVLVDDTEGSDGLDWMAWIPYCYSDSAKFRDIFFNSSGALKNSVAASESSGEATSFVDDIEVFLANQLEILQIKPALTPASYI
ncbi:hypothetical protein AAMO2058_000769800 [Amorphochlora amoebiformis]